MKRALAFLLASAALAAACDDPVHSGEVDALGPEVGRPGPDHRPGQPCLTCHGGSGPAGPQFSVGGTVYAVKGQPDGLAGVTVHLTDSKGSKHDATTSKSGNFYVPIGAWQPSPPVTVQIEYQSLMSDMHTRVGRDGSCAACHFGKPSASTPGPVYLVTDPADLPGAM